MSRILYGKAMAGYCPFCQHRGSVRDDSCQLASQIPTKLRLPWHLHPFILLVIYRLLFNVLQCFQGGRWLTEGAAKRSITVKQQHSSC